MRLVNMPRPNYVRDYSKDRLIGRLVMEKRKRAGKSQDELARSIGRPQSYLSNIENGQHRLDLVELFQLAEALGFDSGAFVKKADRDIYTSTKGSPKRR
jgi:transcriptional regulator with XRE-family HTH domain